MIPFNYKEYYRKVSSLKPRGHVSSGEQVKSPTSPGSRGLNMNKLRPGKRYYD